LGFEPTADYTNFRVCHRREPLYTSYVFDVRDDKLRIVYNFNPTNTGSYRAVTLHYTGYRIEKRKAVAEYAAESFWGGFDPLPAPSEDDELPDDLPI
jgi:hypothetical protein